MEDFTQRGLEDLRAGILRTPLDPFVTFKDGACAATGDCVREGGLWVVRTSSGGGGGEGGT